MSAPILKCKSNAEFQRVWKWLCAARISNTTRHEGLEIEIGVDTPVLGTPLKTFQAAPEMLSMLKTLAGWLACNEFPENVNHLAVLKGLHRLIDRSE